MSRAIRSHLGDFIAIILLVVVGLATTGYILSNERLRFPYIEEKPFHLEVELADAQAVTAGQGQTVRVAGVRVGDIGTVELEDGVAVVGLDIDPEYKDLIRDDATALLRSVGEIEDVRGRRRRRLELLGPRHANSLVRAEGPDDVVAGGDACREDVGILDRLGGALRLKRLHRVRGVAEERRAADRPVREAAPHEHRTA